MNASKRLLKTLPLVLAPPSAPSCKAKPQTTIHGSNSRRIEKRQNPNQAKTPANPNPSEPRQKRFTKAFLESSKKTSSYALTKQIELLKRAANSGASKSSEAAKQLETLESTLANIITDIETAVTLPSLEAAIDLLAPHKRFFLVDIQLSKRLLDSPLRSRIEQTLAQLSRAQDSDRIAALQNALQHAGLSQIVGDSLQTALKDSQSDHILQKWASASPNQSPVPRESFLIRKALGQKDAQLPVSINIRNHDDTRLLNSFPQSLARQLGDTITPVFDQTADFSVTLDVVKFDLDQQIDETSIKSVIPGAIEEMRNQDFVDILAEYTKQAERYEINLQRYERDHDDWIRTYKDDNGELEKGIEKAEEGLEEAEQFAIQNSNPFTGLSPEAQDRMEVARLELQQARNMASSAQIQNRPEPIPPMPVHLDTSKKVYATPSVIITESEATDYTYTQQEILTTFQSAATLTLSSSSSPSPQTQSLELTYDRKWTRNLGLDSRDLRGQQSDYSQDAIASRNRQALLNALSLKASSENTTLPEQERARLYSLAKDPSVSRPRLKERSSKVF